MSTTVGLLDLDISNLYLLSRKISMNLLLLVLLSIVCFNLTPKQPRVGYSVSQAHNPGLDHCHKGIFGLFVQPVGNRARNRVTIIIAFKTCLLYGVLPSFLSGHAFGHTLGVT